MDYRKIYTNLIEKARDRTLNCYTEKHHIIHRCMGGCDDHDNLVELTAEEHYVAHQLLVKMYPHNNKLIYAANMMCVNATQRNNKAYGWIRRKWISQISKDRTGTKATEEQRKKMSESHRGDKNSMYGLHGDNHPAYGQKPWRNQITMKGKHEWRYAGIFYDWYINDIKAGIYKRQGHKRMLQELQIATISRVPRTSIELFKKGWNPYEDTDWVEWANNQ